MVDGLWGEHEWTLYPQPYRHEHPYLAWLRLPPMNAASDTLTRPVHKKMWQAHPSKSNIHLVDPGVFSVFSDKLQEVKAAVMDPFHDIITDTRFSCIQRPQTAYNRAFEALDRLAKDFEAWRDFVEVVRCLQRNFLELLAFADWWHDIQQGEDFRPPFRAPTREDLYANHARWSIACYLIVPNQELQRLHDGRPPPPWFPKQQSIWVRAMNHVSHVDLKEGQSPRRFALPPLHLFWGASEQNQRTYYYHLLVLRNEFSLRSEGDLPGLTTGEWRTVLGNTYWKSMWPRPTPDDAGSSNFDPLQFWIHGGPLFFGDKTNAEVTSGCNVTSVLRCRCEVQMDSADDDEVRQTVLYHLNMEHAAAEIREMDRLQFPLDYKERWMRGRRTAIEDMTDMWNPIRNSAVNSLFFADKKSWRAWLQAVRTVVMDWDSFDDWDWEGFTDVRNMGFKQLSFEDFRSITVRILIFFIRSFVTRLGYFPSPMLCPPTLANQRCTTHRKNFGAGLI
jgi:predicted small metal-binding protein